MSPLPESVSDDAGVPAVALRPGTASDLAAIVAIYNHYVTTTPITFDTEPFTEDTRRPWFDGFADEGPYRLFVAEAADTVIGFASSTPFNPRPAYATSVETSVYMHPDVTGRGLGRLLYSVLLDALDKEPGLHRAYGGITLPNDASVALHERLGFTLVGTFREVGYKFERFWDVARYERPLAGGRP